VLKEINSKYLFLIDTLHMTINFVVIISVRLCSGGSFERVSLSCKR